MSEGFAFDRFTVSRAERRLYADGAPVPVSSPGFRLLVALVERAGTLVTKDELIRLVWGSAAITENALHVQVAALRRAVGSHLIITQSGIGYKFVGQPKKPAEPKAPAAAKPRATPARALLGRDAQLKELEKALAKNRFVTLTGPGGVGKTSLARALSAATAEKFPDGVFWCELAALRDQAGLEDAVKAALQIEGGFDAKPLADVLARLAGKSALLVLDNCEHLLPGAAALADALFAGAPGLAILATSRQALGCGPEHVAPVPTLDLPAADVAGLKLARRSPAFRLFLERVTALDPHFAIAAEDVPVAARICRSLDGLPLALEIVAGWAGVLGLETLEKKLNTAPFAWAHARKTAPARHYDLKSALGWSFDLLSPPEQALLRRVSVFAQDFSLGAAEQVAAGDVLAEGEIFTDLAHLVEKSLVSVVPATRPTAYRLLETTRAFAQEKLRAAGEEGSLRYRHANYVLDKLTVAEAAWDTIRGEKWLARYAGLIVDVRWALDWALARGGNTEVGLAIAAASWPLWRELSLRVEGARRIQAALDMIGPETAKHVQARLFHGFGRMVSDNQADRARAAFEKSASLCQKLPDRKLFGTVLLGLAFTLFALGDGDGAARNLAEGRLLLSHCNSQRWLAASLALGSLIDMHNRRFDEALEAGRQAVRLYEAMGAERSALTAKSNLLDVALCKNDLPTALAEGRDLAARLRATPFTGLLGIVLVNLVAALVRAEQLDEALTAAHEAARLLPDHRPLFVLLDHLALRCALTGDVANAAMLAGFTNAAYRAHGWPRLHVEQAASDRLADMLAETLPDHAVQRLLDDGASLTEAAAWALAVGQVQPAARMLAHAAA